MRDHSSEKDFQACFHLVVNGVPEYPLLLSEGRKFEFELGIHPMGLSEFKSKEGVNTIIQSRITVSLRLISFLGKRQCVIFMTMTFVCKEAHISTYYPNS